MPAMPMGRLPNLARGPLSFGDTHVSPSRADARELPPPTPHLAVENGMRGCGTACWLLLCLTSAAADRIARTSDNGFHAAFSLCANFTMVNRAAAQFVYDGVARLN